MSILLGLRKNTKGDRTMPEYHVGCGFTGIFAGTLNKKGDMWRTKSEVTAEVLGSAAQHLLFNKTEFRFECNGRHYVLKVERWKDGTD